MPRGLPRRSLLAPNRAVPQRTPGGSARGEDRGVRYPWPSCAGMPCCPRMPIRSRTESGGVWSASAVDAEGNSGTPIDTADEDALSRLT